MKRLTAFGLASVLAIVGAGGLYQAYIIPANFDHWTTLKTLRDLSLIAVALLWLFWPSRIVVPLVLIGLFAVPVAMGLKAWEPVHYVGAVVCLGLALAASQVRRSIPSPFNWWARA